MDRINKQTLYNVVCQFEKIFRLIYSYRFSTAGATAYDADRWITLGGGKNDWNESTGRHVKIDERGNIVGGSLPRSAQGKPINSWWKNSGESPKNAGQSGKSSATSPKIMSEEEMKRKSESGEIAGGIYPFNYLEQIKLWRQKKAYAIAPATEGSQKQIKWANEIKLNLLAHAANDISRIIQRRNDDPKMQAEGERIYNVIMNGINNEKSARKLIDNRNASAEKLYKMYGEEDSASKPQGQPEVEAAIKKYGISPIWDGPNKGKIMVNHAPEAANELSALKAKIPEIKKYFAKEKEKEDAEQNRREKNVSSIPGLKEIESLREANEKWNDAFSRSFRSAGGMGVGPKPKGNEEELLKKYPQAAAYLQVRGEANKSNYELAGIGKKALSQFEDDPSKWKSIVANMEREISKFTEKHEWD